MHYNVNPEENGVFIPAQAPSNIIAAPSLGRPATFEQVIQVQPPLPSTPGQAFNDAVLGRSQNIGLRFIHSDNEASYFEASATDVDAASGRRKTSIIAQRIGTLLASPNLAVNMKYENPLPLDPDYGLRIDDTAR